MTQPLVIKNEYGEPQRLRFPGDEDKFEWLPTLLDAYYIADQGVAEGIRRRLKQGRTLACAKGCSNCCKSHKTIPVYPLELVGMTWYVTERLAGPQRRRLKDQLRDHRSGEACPFLVDGVCAVHPMRPMACRQFNVFGQACSEGEDAYYTRRQDVLTPLKEYVDRAFDRMLPFYGITKKAERRHALKNGTLHGIVRVLQECAWDSVADKMEAFDQAHPGRRPADA